MRFERWCDGGGDGWLGLGSRGWEEEKVCWFRIVVCMLLNRPFRRIFSAGFLD